MRPMQSMKVVYTRHTSKTSLCRVKRVKYATHPTHQWWVNIVAYSQGHWSLDGWTNIQKSSIYLGTFEYLYGLASHVRSLESSEIIWDDLFASLIHSLGRNMTSGLKCASKRHLTHGFSADDLCIEWWMATTVCTLLIISPLCVYFWLTQCDWLLWYSTQQHSARN